MILDSTKPITEQIKIIDQHKINSKKRYNIKHDMEERYRDMDFIKQKRTEKRRVNKLSYRKFQDLSHCTR